MRKRIVLVGVAIVIVVAGLTLTKPGRTLLAYAGIVAADDCAQLLQCD
jgi:hypothetical protein